MSAKQIIKDNQDKLLQILLYKEYQDYNKNCIIDHTMIDGEGDIYVIDPDVCTDCGSCAEVCPVEAIHPAE